MSYHLDTKKEEEIKVLLKTCSVRDIVAKTGVAKQTIARIRNENFTKEERAAMKKQHMRKNLDDEKENGTMSTNKGKKCSSKKCRRHGQVLLLTEFNKNRATPDGYDYHCRQCKAGEAQARCDRLKKGDSSGKIEGKKQFSPGRGSITASRISIPAIDGLDAQLAIDLKQMKRRIAKEVMEIYRTSGERAVEEAFA